MNRGIRLHNKVPDYIKEFEKDKAVKRRYYCLLYIVLMQMYYTLFVIYIVHWILHV
jgi:hypothetical protein